MNLISNINNPANSTKKLVKIILSKLMKYMKIYK